MCPGQRSGSDHPARRRNRATLGSGSRIYRRLSVGMARSVGRNLCQLGRQATRLRLRRRSEEICSLRWISDWRRCPTWRIKPTTLHRIENSMHLGVTQKGKETKVLVIAGFGFRPGRCRENVPASADFLRRLHARSVGDYYRAYLDKTVSLELPDAASAAGLRLGAHQHDSRHGEQSVPGNWLGCGISDFRSRTAAGVRMVLWPRFPLDFVCSQRRRRLCDHSHRARFHQQISARRRQGSARDLAERKPRSLVQGLSLRVRFCRCDATIHHRDE